MMYAARFLMYTLRLASALHACDVAAAAVSALTFRVTESSGGNTGARTIEVYGCASSTTTTDDDSSASAASARARARRLAAAVGRAPLLVGGCDDDATCDRWGAPYIHKNHFTQGKCWKGFDAAPCGQTPSDRHHQRLCACSGNFAPEG